MTSSSPASMQETSDEPDQSPHVMFVLHSMGAGGSERVITTIANFWAAQGRKVSIVTFDAVDEDPFYALSEKVTLYRLGLQAISSPIWRALQRTHQRILALRKTFKKSRPDIVISFLTKTNIMALQAARGLNLPVIISERNNPNAQHVNELWHQARARSYPRAYAFVTMTQGAAAYYPEKQRPRTTIIPNPITLPNNWHNRRGNNVLTAVGRLTEQKRFDLLIDAFGRIASDFPDWTLIIWGEGEDRQALEKQRDAQNLTDRIQLPGLTPSPGTWVESADVFVLSSAYEGWANVLLEAMAAGLPIVSTDCPYSPADLLDHGESGLLVKNGDTGALADSLSALLSDEGLRKTLGENAQKASQQYTTENIIAQWDTLVRSALRG